DQWARNRAVEPGRAQPAPAPPPAPAPAPRPARPEPKGQVVDVAPTGKPEAPQNARFLGERDNTVEKETRSRYARPGFERTLPTPTQPTPQMAPARPQPPTPAGGGGQGEGQVAEARKPGAQGAPGVKQPPRVAMAKPDAEPPAPGGILPRPQPPAPPQQPGPRGEGGESGEGGSRATGRAGPLLAPSADFYDRLRGGPAPDHLQDVDVGEGTFLNTREWRYAGYFNRIKQSVSMTWDPSGAVRSRDPTGERYLFKDRVTVLSITLNADGGLTDAHVVKTSGVDFLDRAAVEAFQKAQPFVNPPTGLADAGGEIKFTFGFYLEVGSPGMRLFRGPAQ
ncbi:MAG TPA: TonB family protein, partial [Anaeromyxobacteraceae bacterium]|nr:TonB family protein [Anaeromyxobacteraceae bacterium]